MKVLLLLSAAAALTAPRIAPPSVLDGLAQLVEWCGGDPPAQRCDADRARQCVRGRGGGSVQAQCSPR